MTVRVKYERSADARIGEVLAGRYRLEAVLGTGGAGVLFRASHVRTGRALAVKLLHGGDQDSVVAGLRLEREALTTANLQHPNVVEVLDLGEDETGTPYLVMELLHGGSLHERIERDGPLSLQHTFDIVVPILGVLAQAHARGVLHRDLKPANIFLAEAPGGRVIPKLLDFGIAKIEGGQALTQPGKLIGTVGFMSPEHVHGAELSAASDLWSLATVIFVCLTGALPYSPELIAAGKPPRFPDGLLERVGAMPFAAVIEHALEWHARARFSDARAFARALLTVAQRHGLRIPEAPDPLGLPQWPSWRAELGREQSTLAVTQPAERTPAEVSPAFFPRETGVHPAALPNVGDTLSSRFTLLQAIGRGAMGAVYEAEDRQSQDRVALKVLHRLEPSAIYRIKREFRALAEVSHPNLVALHELFGDEHGRFFFTMQLVRGCSFLEYVRSFGRTFDEVRLRACMLQLTRGVQHLHAAGKLHRDLKPSNVLVTEEGRLLIVDFGLAHPIAEPDLQVHTEHDFLGTPAYAAPEQIDPQRSAPASDWYAVGVMLYEALTGQTPFSGNSHQMMLEKTRREPQPPSERVGHGLPKDLERICMRLLARAPEERADGRDLLAAAGAPAQESEGEAQTLLIGRDAELAQLHAWFERACKGQLSAAFVSAASGMGKTTLIERFLRELRLGQHAIVLRGRCYAQEALYYKAWDGVVDALSAYLRQLSGDSATALLPQDTVALAQVFPVLRRVESIAHAALSAQWVDEQGLRKRAFAALRKLLENIARRTPVVVFVDDLQWGDVDSARLLRELLSPPPIPGLYFLAAYRSEARSSAPMLTELFRNGGPDAKIVHLELGPLDEGAVRELATRLLQDTLSPEAPSEIARNSEGHPMLAAELIRYARESGGLSQLRGLSLDTAISTQLSARLSQSARTLLEVICVAGQRLPRSLVFAAAGGGDLAALRELRLLRAVRESVLGEELHVEPYHDRVREVIISELSPNAARALHASLAEGMLARGDLYLEAAVHHCLRAGRAQQAGALAERAARQATAALAFERAADLLELALQHAQDAEAQALMRRALADACVRAGRTLSAAQHYDRAASDAAGPERFELQRSAMAHYLVSGHTRRGTELLRALASELGLPLTRQRLPLFSTLRFLAKLLWLGWTGRPRLQQRPHAPHEPHESHELHDAGTQRLRAQLRLLWSAAPSLFHVSALTASVFAAQALDLAARLGESVLYAQALSMRMSAIAFMFGKRTRGIERRFAHAHLLSGKHGDAWDRGFVRVMDGTVDLLTVRFRSALDTCLPIAISIEPRNSFATSVQSTARAVAVPALYWLGEEKRLAELLESWIKEAEDSGDRHLEVNFRILGAHRSLRSDDVEAARNELSRARATELDYLHPALCDPWWEAGVALYAGDPQHALAVSLRMAENFATRSAASGPSRTVWHLTVGTCAAALLARGIDPVGSRKRLVESIAMARRTSQIGASAIASHLAGTLAALDGQRERAFTQLQRAIVGYDEHGMRLYVASLRLGLAALEHPDADTLRARALRTFEAEGIENPARWAAMLAPGLSSVTH